MLKNACLLRLPIMWAICVVMASSSASCQALNWEGQHGVLITPLAYTVPTEGNIGLVAGYHYLNGGSVLGGFHQVSVTAAVLNRLEFGYTRDIHQSGSTAGLSPLWDSGFNIFHGKWNLLREAVQKNGLAPAISVGFVARTQVHNVSGMLANKTQSNGDFYIVASKTITDIKHLPIVLDAGFKATNASLFGLAGNAPAYKGRFFGAAAVAFAVKRSTIFLAAEAVQQPHDIQGAPGLVVPTTLSYAIRFVPAGALPSLHGWGEEVPRLNIDFAIVQVGNNLGPGVAIQASRQFGMGVSYQF